MQGKSGADTLWGGEGDDSLWGSRIAADPAHMHYDGYQNVFGFTAGTGDDTIFDFQDGTDKIGLAGGLDWGDVKVRMAGGTYCSLCSPTTQTRMTQVISWAQWLIDNISDKADITSGRLRQSSDRGYGSVKQCGRPFGASLFCGPSSAIQGALPDKAGGSSSL